MLALKPGLFPLPALRRLLFPRSAFHSGFNSLQTLFLMDFSHGGPQHAQAPHRSPKKISRTPSDTKRGGSCSHTSLSLPPWLALALSLMPRTPKRVGSTLPPLGGAAGSSCVPKTSPIPSHEGAWRCPRCPRRRAGAPKGPSPSPQGGARRPEATERGAGRQRWSAPPSSGGGTPRPALDHSFLFFFTHF